MNWVDIAVIAVVVLSGMLSAMRGVVREVLGMGAWLGSAAIAAESFSRVQPQFRAAIANPDIADAASLGSVFVVSLVVLWIVAHILGGLVRGSLLGGLDRTLGVVYGLLRGAALVVFAYILAGMVTATDQWPEPVLAARSLPIVYQGAVLVAGLFPEGYQPHVTAPPPGRETRAADLLHANPQGRAIGRP